MKPELNSFRDNIVSLWELNETTGTNAADAVGSNDGTYTNTPTLAQSTVTNLTYSVLFDGEDQYVNCGTDASLDAGSDDFTLACWIKTSGQITDIRVIGGKGGTFTGGKRYTFFINNGKWFFDIDDNSAAKNVIANSDLDDSAWHFLVGVRDGNNLRFYVDGVEQTASPIDITGYGSLDSAKPFLIGALEREDTDVVDLEFPGYIDQPMFIKRVWSQSDIDYWYNEGAGRAH